MQTVQTLEGHDARVVDEGDLLTAERKIKWFLIGIMGAIVSAGVIVGVSYATIATKVDLNASRIEEVRREGSIPLQNLKSDILLLRQELSTHESQQAQMLELLNRIERRVR